MHNFTPRHQKLGNIYLNSFHTGLEAINEAQWLECKVLPKMDKCNTKKNIWIEQKNI